MFAIYTVLLLTLLLSAMGYMLYQIVTDTIKLGHGDTLAKVGISFVVIVAIGVLCLNTDIILGVI